MWEAVFKVAPPLIQAVSVAVTAVFAVIGLRAWRRQLLGRRKIEIAEGTLLATYKIKEAMAYIRNPGALVGASTRQRQPDESESLARLRDTYFVPRTDAEDQRRLRRVREDAAPLPGLLRARCRRAV